MLKRERTGLLTLSAVTVVLGAIIVGGVYWLGVLTGRGQRVENRALESSTYESQWRGLLDLVSARDLAIALVALVVLAVVQRNPRGAIRAVLIIGVANVVAQVLKYGILVRPDFAALDARNTFPSGHAVAFSSVLFVLIIIVPARIRVLVAVFASLVLGVVVFQLLGFGWHRLSDVIGGVMITLSAVGLAHLVVPPRMTDARWRAPFGFRVYSIGATVLFAAAAVALLLIAAIVRGSRESGLLLLATQAAAIGSVVFAIWFVCLIAPRIAPRRTASTDATGRSVTA